MRLACIPLAVVALGCSPGRPTGEPDPTGESEPIASAAQPIVWSPQQRLLPESSGFGAFGVFVALDANTALVSDHWDGTDAKPQSGSVHVFSLANGSWTRDQVLVPTTSVAFGFFGFGSAIDQETAMIGAPGEAKGAVYVWLKGGATWSQTERLLPASAAVGDSFGEAVAIAGDRAVIGAPKDDTLGAEVGAAYVYRRSGGSWQEEAKLLPDDPRPGATFGAAVAIQDDTLLIGAPALSANPSAGGRVHVFKLDAGQWVSADLLLPALPSADDAFGRAVAISSDAVVVGAPANSHGREDAPGTLHSYLRVAGEIGSAAILSCPNPAPGDECGHAVELTAAQLVVGAPGFNGVGAAFSAQRSPTGFTDWQRLDADGAGPDDGIGTSVALSTTACLLGTRDVLDGSAYAFALLGPACADASDCANGVCTEGVCCDRACDGACETCTAAGREGICETVPAGTATQACEAYVCGEYGGCKTSCDSTADCALGSVCDASGRCSEAPQATEVPSSCGIASTPRPMPAGLWWLVALAGLVWRRRRSRPGPVRAPEVHGPSRARNVHARQHGPRDLG